LSLGLPSTVLIALGGASAVTVSRSMPYTAVGVHYAEMQDVHTFLWPLSP